MGQFFHNISILLGIVGISSAVTFGVVLVCRWMKWAPINININVGK